MGRLNYHSTYIDHQGFWQMNGYGLLAVYKSDWIRFGGKFKVNLTAEERNVPFFGGGGGWRERDSKNRIADFELPDDKV